MTEKPYQEVENGGSTDEPWWTHRRLLEEAELVLPHPMAEGTIFSCIKDAKELARDLLEAAAAAATTTCTTSDGADAAANDTRLMERHDELILVRNRLFGALVAAQHEQQETSTDNFGVGARSEVHVDGGKHVALRRTSHQMLLHAIIGEWAAQRWTAAGEGDENSLMGHLVDSFLTGVVFTYASKWNKGGADSMVDVVHSFLVDTLGMTPVEQERLLPRFVKHTWDAFLLELQDLEEEVRRVCVVGKGWGVEMSEEGGEEALLVHKRHAAARALVLRVVQVLKILAVSPSAGPDGGTAAAAAAAAGKSIQRGHVVVTTSSKAKVLVESLGRWLPMCGNFLRSMVPLRYHEKEVRSSGHHCNNDADDDADGGGGGGGRHAASIGEEVENIAATVEAREWIRRLQQQVQRVFMQLAEFDETSPWTVVLADIAARTFFIARGHDKSEGDDDDNDGRQHAALKAFMVWYKVGDVSISSTATTGSGGGGGGGGCAPRTLVEACSTKMNHVLSCALDTKSSPVGVSIRVLRVLLVQRPLATLRHFLSTSLCPVNSVAAACDCEAAITEKERANDSRATAFAEEPLEGNEVARAFFPKYLAVFSYIERALESLCDVFATTATATATANGNGNGNRTDDNAKDNTVSAEATTFSRLVEQFIAAAFDESFTAFIHAGTAASEWLMFLAFICTETPVFDVTTLHHVRRAARRFFAPGRMMMTYLHHHIVQLQCRGLVAFFLPPLRAIGVDYSTATDYEHLSCALRYPLSAEVAYFQELPRGYYARQPLRLALNAKNDALQFFHELLMSPMAVTPLKKPPTSVAGMSPEGDNTMVRELFIDIVAHVGVVVAARVRGEADRRSVDDPATMDAMASVFFGVLRLCSSVTYWDATRRQDVQRAIVRRLCVLSKSSASAPRVATAAVATVGGRGGAGWTPPLPMAFLLRGGCALSGTGTAYNNNNKDNILDIDITASTAVSECGDGSAEPHAWHDWFCAAEFEDLDARAGSCAMALLRSCNRTYMKCIPTKTLLARRVTLEQHAARERDSGVRVHALAAMEAAIEKDVQVLREQWRRNGEAAQEEQERRSKGAAGLVAGEDGDGSGDDAVAVSASALDGLKMEAGVEAMGLSADVPANSDTQTAASIPGSAAPDGMCVKKGNDGRGKGGAQLPHHQDGRPLPLAVVKPYIETVVALLMQRARMSVVDGVAAGVALTKWLMAATGKFEPQVLLEVVRWVVLQVNTKLTHATKLECASLSALLGVIIDDVALPYKLSFFSARPAHGVHHHQQQQEQQPQGNVSAGASEWGSDGGVWTRHCLPASEKDAVALLRLLIADTTRAVTRFLKEATLLSDWKAYKLLLHTRRIMGLVKSYVVTFRAALEKRLQELGASSAAGVLSSFGEGMHPVQLLAAVECPVLARMSAPATDVDHLFTPAITKTTTTTTTAAAAAAVTPVGNGGGSNSNFGGNRSKWAAYGDAFRRKRHRSVDDDYHHTHRHRKRKNTPREHAK